MYNVSIRSSNPLKHTYIEIKNALFGAQEIDFL